MSLLPHAATLIALVLPRTGGGGTPETEDPGSGLVRLNLAEDVTLKVFGRLFIDWGWFHGDDRTYSTDTSGDTNELDDGTEFRAARLGVEGTLFEMVHYKVEYDFAKDSPASGEDLDGDGQVDDGTVSSGSVQAKDVYVALKDTPVGEVRVGHYKEPFSLEQLTSARFITFMERSLADAFVPGRNSGLSILDHNSAKTMTWSAGVFRTTDDSAFDTGDGEYSVTGRVTGMPWNRDEGESLLHLGAALSYRMDDSVRFRSRPESDFLNRPADTGSISADETVLGGLETACVLGPVSIQAEVNVASVNSSSGGGGDRDYSGFYAFVSWFLTGEHRAYKATTGSFDRVKPRANLGAGAGAIELAARYSMIDLDDRALTADEMSGATFGVNWYLNPNARLMLNLIHSEFEDSTVDDSMDAILLRFQVDW
jgi:phosphate-selective porin OprO/OprP